MEAERLKQVLEAALMITDGPLSLDRMMGLFEEEEEPPKRDKVRRTLEELEVDYENAGIQLIEVASGFRFQARAEMAPWMNRMFEERRPKYSRALLETLAIIAYRQPITRGEIESIRGVAVSTGIVRTLLEREWVRVVGHRDVPGRPSVYATTKGFLDYFNLSSMDQLPSLAELKDFDDINADLFDDMPKDTAPTEGMKEVPTDGQDNSEDDADEKVLDAEANEETNSELGSETVSLNTTDSEIVSGHNNDHLSAEDEAEKFLEPDEADSTEVELQDSEYNEDDDMSAAATS